MEPLYEIIVDVRTSISPLCLPLYTNKKGYKENSRLMDTKMKKKFSVLGYFSLTFFLL